MTTHYVGLCDNSNWAPDISPHVEVVDDINRMSPSLLAKPDITPTCLEPLEAARAYVAQHKLGPRIAVNVNTMIGCIELALNEKYWVTYDHTHYYLDTRLDVLSQLQALRHSKKRVRLWYGDSANGRCWGDYEDGYIGRSMGPIRIPLSIFNSRSSGGPAVLTHCIVKIQTTKGKETLWQHPGYQPFVCPYCDAEHGVREACLVIPRYSMESPNQPDWENYG